MPESVNNKPRSKKALAMSCKTSPNEWNVKAFTVPPNETIMFFQLFTDVLDEGLVVGAAGSVIIGSIGNEITIMAKDGSTEDASNVALQV
jgi:hypothetical protein